MAMKIALHRVLLKISSQNINYSIYKSIKWVVLLLIIFRLTQENVYYDKDNFPQREHRHKDIVRKLNIVLFVSKWKAHNKTYKTALPLLLHLY